MDNCIIIQNNKCLNEDEQTNNENKIFPLIKEYNFSLDDDIYTIRFEFNKESLKIKATKNVITPTVFYKNEYTSFEISEIYKKLKNNNNENEIQLISNYLNNSSNIKLKKEGNHLILFNKDDNIIFKLEKYIPEENEIIDDIFSKISLLEEQINNFSNYGKKLSNTLNEYGNKLEKIKNN